MSSIPQNYVPKYLSKKSKSVAIKELKKSRNHIKKANTIREKKYPVSKNKKQVGLPK